MDEENEEMAEAESYTHASAQKNKVNRLNTEGSRVEMSLYVGIEEVVMPLTPIEKNKNTYRRPRCYPGYAGWRGREGCNSINCS